MNEDFVLKCIRQTPDDKNAIALDIGANHGKYTMLLSRKFEQVYAFEPYPFNVVFLKRNLVSRTNVSYVEKAVSNVEGTVKFYVNHYNPGGHTINPNVAGTNLWGHDLETFVEVPTITLDKWSEENSISEKKVALIKCDVEGAEDFLFEGAKNFLTTHSPRIILEVHQRVDLKKLYNLFTDLGYHFYNETTETKTTELNNDQHYLIIKGNS